MNSRRQHLLLVFLCLAAAWTHRLRGDITVVPLTGAQVGQDPFKFNGVIMTEDFSEGSGAVVRHTNVVLSAAHVVYDEQSLLDPWAGEVRWFWKYHASGEPAWTKGKALRGYTRFSSYQFVAESSGNSSPSAVAWDLVAHFAYEGLAGGQAGAWWTNGISALRTSHAKMVTGYPSGIYSFGDPDEYKMHVAGPFSFAFSVKRGAYLGADGVAVGSGTSGGPVWVQEDSGTWGVAGVLVLTSAKALGGPINSIGIRAIDVDAWALVDEAISVSPPSNDSFSTGTVISGLPNSVKGSNIGATQETDEPEHADEAGGRSVWWTWTAAADQTVTIDTIGSTFDTLLAVYTGNSVTNLTAITADDDSGGDVASKVTLTAERGTEYHIAVDGLGSSSGSIVLNLVPPPPNDQFSARTMVQAPAAEVTGSNVSGSKEIGEPNHAGVSGAQSVWWTWVMPANGTVTMDTIGSSFDTLLAVYTGDSVFSLTSVASDNDSGGNGASRLTFSGTAGTAYHIAVDGFRGGEGRIALNIRRGIQITRQPVSRTIAPGGSAIFGVSVAGTTSPKYQWQKDGAALPGATNSTYTIASAQIPQAGAYSVSVSDSSGSVVSSKALLTLRGPYAFSTLAGSPPYGSTNGTGNVARFFVPRDVAVDNAGNLYVADTLNNIIRRITPSGTVTTLAGSPGELGNEDGTGRDARFAYPMGVAVDSANRIYVADYLNHVIRRVTLGGTVTTWAGSTNGFYGSADGARTAARFAYPTDVAGDSAGNLFVADTGNHIIRKITSAGVVSTLAGTALRQGSGDGAGSAARFAFPQGVAVDSAGNVYVADSGNDTIRKITQDGVVSTLAGLAGNSGHADGVGSAASFTNPVGIAVDAAGNVYVSEDYSHTIRKITPAGVVTTLAGSAGISGSDDGIGTAARFKEPFRMTVDNTGNLLVADSGNSTIRRITPEGAVSTWAGKPSVGAVDGMGAEALFANPSGVVVDGTGHIYVADFENHTIRKIAPSGVVSTLAGMPGTAGSADGKGSQARFNHPEALALDRAGNLYVTDTWNHTVRKVAPDGSVSTLAGLAGTYGSADGDGNAVRFFYPFGVAVDGAGSVFVTDGYNHTIRKITPGGAVTTFAGKAGSYGHADGAGSNAQFNGPDGLAADTSGNLYVADYGNHVIRKVSPNGLVTTLAGSPGVAGSADGVGEEASFTFPHGVAVDHTGHVYVADRGNDAIRMITPDGVVSTIAGSPKDLRGSTDGTGNAARFFFPGGVAVDSAGRLYVADSGNNTIRKGTPSVFTLDAARPTLRIEFSGQDLVLSWPTNAVDFVLESSASLTLPIWSQLSLAPAVKGENYAASIPVSAGNRFFRLRRP
ncbi:MAG: hypothetical protein HY735_16640 [Verrucomicrobia bacterium]|nr:hypothetical protein [Verrucomicrobiota bacterium]